MKFINLTPHTINLNNGVKFNSEGVCRVSTAVGRFDKNLIATQTYGPITELPEPQDNTVFIVSGLVAAAVKIQQPHRNDIVAPATGHADAIRNDKGHIVSVPGFVR